MGLLYSIRILREVSLILSQFMRLTDRWVDGNLTAKNVLHSMQHSKNS